MMHLLRLTMRSLINRRLTSILTVFSIALSVALLMGIERIRTGARESFGQTISQTDLIVGAKGGSIQLLLYTVFRIGTATDNISYESYKDWAAHPEIAWTIPFSLGDSHRGYRVVGTDKNFYTHYRYRRERHVEFAQGQAPSGVFDVALGAEVAQKLNYKIADRLVLAHGVSEVAFQDHADKPFRVVGILSPTGTPIDRSLYVTLEGLEAIHIDWSDGAPPVDDKKISAADVIKQKLDIKQITAFLLGAKSRLSTLTLQRQINDYEEEALMAIIPGVTLGELWDGLSYAEEALRLVSFFVLVVGLLGMVVTIYNSLNERRREMAILRALGSRPVTIFFLLVSESFLLSLSGFIGGWFLTHALLWGASGWLEEQFGLVLSTQIFSDTDTVVLVLVGSLGLLLGVLPAWRAYKNTLQDGLTIRL